MNGSPLDIYQEAWIWPSTAYLAGTQLVFKRTGYNGDIHWTGTMTVSENEESFHFWKWLWSNSRSLPLLIDEAKFNTMVTLKDLDSSSTLVSPADGVYILSKAAQAAPEGVELLRERLKKQGFQTSLYEVPEEAQSNSWLWDVIGALSSDRCFVYCNGECTFSCRFCLDAATQSYEFEQIELKLASCI